MKYIIGIVIVVVVVLVADFTDRARRDANKKL